MNVLMPYLSNKDPDEPVYSRSLIKTFVALYLNQWIM